MPWQLVQAAAAGSGRVNYQAALRPLPDYACPLVRVCCIPAGGKFDNERKHTLIRQIKSAISIAPPNRSKTAADIHTVHYQMRIDFPGLHYRQRVLVESAFSTAKHKLETPETDSSLHIRMRQALLLEISFNLYRLH